MFFCIISWLGVFQARLMSEIFTLRKIMFNTALSCWIYLPRVTNYLGDKFLILNKKDWNIYLIFRTFQVLNSINNEQTVFKQKFLPVSLLKSVLNASLFISDLITSLFSNLSPVKYLSSFLTPGILILGQGFFFGS